jgi:hypothetical protein
MIRRLICLSVAGYALASFFTAAHAADPISLTGKIDSVTVYRGQALVTRTVDVSAPAGLTDIVVTGLPERVIPGSVYAESADGIDIHSVGFRTRAVEQDNRVEVQQIDKLIRADQDDLDAVNRSQQVLAQRSQYLDKLESFAAPTAMTELSKGVLNADVLKALTTFIFDQRKDISDESLDLSHKQRAAQEQLDLHQRQRAELTGGSTKSVREAVVSVTFKNAGGQLRVHYLVDQADWTASYIAHGNPSQQSVNLEYDASVRQMSGEDWPDVDMILSTATPSLVATAPVLDPLEIALASVPYANGQTAVTSAYAEQRDALIQQRTAAEANRSLSNNYNGPVTINGGALSNGSFNGNFGVTQQQLQNLAPAQSLDSDLNSVARQLQVLELVAEATKPQTPSEGHQSVSVTYHLTNRTTLPSRADEQLIQISTLALKGTFYKTAMPVLTSFIYDQASVVNDGKNVLLAGPVSSYQNDHFVGIGQLPTVTTGESFTLGFGIDASLRAGRELVEKTDTVQAGNRVLGFNYKLTIENFGNDPAIVRLMDRVPTTKANEAKITLGATSKELSAAPEYLPDDKTKGILRWDVSVPAQAIGDKAATVTHQFKVEYDKQLTVSSAALTAGGFGGGGGGRGGAGGGGGAGGAGRGAGR